MSVIAVDVDLTVVDTLSPWMREFYQRTGRFVRNLDGAYNLLPEMLEIMHEEGVQDYDPYAFWKRSDLYDDLVPLEYCVDELQAMKHIGHEIVFVSSCVPEHTASKQRFLTKFFPFADAFIATHDKHYVAYDIIIDDKIQHLKDGMRQRPNARHLLYTGIRVDGKPGEHADYEELINWRNLYAQLYF